MKKTIKKLFSMIMVFAITMFNFLPFFKVTTVYADPVEPQTITFQLDGAPVSGNNVITFNVGNEAITATVSGIYEFSEGNLVVDYSNINNLKLTLSQNYDNSRMHLDLNGQVIAVNENYEATFNGLDYSDDRPHLQIVSNGGGEGSGGGGPQYGDNTQNHNGNATATLNYSINGIIEYSSGGGFDHGISFRINGIPYAADESKMQYSKGPAYERDEQGQIIRNENNEPIPKLDTETLEQMTEDTGLTIEEDTIHYDYDTNTNKVNFTFTMAPGTLMTGLIINGQEITNLPSTREELEAHYIDHRLEIEVNNIDKADIYNIAIEARYPNSAEEFMGNFLWDYNKEGYTGPEDKILNATMTFVEAEYDGHKYTTPEEINALGGVYIWKDAPRKKVYTSDREGCGEAQFPVGTKLTVKIIPDAGYQLIDFGINGGVFDPQEEIGTYTFEVQGGPFHLQATIAQVEDVVKTTSEKIESGSILLGEEEAMAIGTARLDVSDIELTNEQISNFKEAAEGYSINNYIDISLFNTVFKGSENKSWDTEVKDLENEATITLKLEDGVNGDEVVIVHEKHDGTYEIIPVEYDEKNNTITFKTKSFSNYAIATKDSVDAPKTYDGIIKWMLISSASLIGLLVLTKKFKKINIKRIK